MERPGKQKSKHLFLQRATILENYPRRYNIAELEPYAFEQFHGIAVHLLEKDFARIIADAVWNTSRNLRDCIIIASEEDVNFIIEKIVHHRDHKDMSSKMGNSSLN